jgi:hypothetical protein
MYSPCYVALPLLISKRINKMWPEVISNEDLGRRTGEIEMSRQIRRRKWNWVGHTVRKGHEAIEREALD